MRANTRFTVAIHILAAVALSTDEVVTSDLLAKSVNTNSVVIRRINAMLKKAGLISVRAGVGGTELLKNPKDISLYEIYKAVNPDDEMTIIQAHKHPNANCPIGSNILKAIDEPLIVADKALKESLSNYTLEDVSSKILKFQ